MVNGGSPLNSHNKQKEKKKSLTAYCTPRTLLCYVEAELKMLKTDTFSLTAVMIRVTYGKMESSQSHAVKSLGFFSSLEILLYQSGEVTLRSFLFLTLCALPHEPHGARRTRAILNPSRLPAPQLALNIPLKFAQQTHACRVE